MDVKITGVIFWYFTFLSIPKFQIVTVQFCVIKEWIYTIILKLKAGSTKYLEAKLIISKVTCYIVFWS